MPCGNALVAEAVQHNPDLRVAAARVQVASEYANLADSTLYPQVNLLARGGGEMSGDSSGLKGVGLFADWELDLWGRVRSAHAASQASYESVVADTEYARQSVAALVAKSYFLAVEAGLQQQLAGETVTAAEQLVTLAEQRQRVGKDDGYDVSLERANAESLRDTVEQFSLARSQSLRALEALLGRYPAADIEVATALAARPAAVPAGLPSELLERRPDVVAAERRVAAAFYGVEEAKAARLPRISLTASVNDISSELFVLQERDNPVWSAGIDLYVSDLRDLQDLRYEGEAVIASEEGFYTASLILPVYMQSGISATVGATWNASGNVSVTLDVGHTLGATINASGYAEVWLAVRPGNPLGVEWNASGSVSVTLLKPLWRCN